MALDLLGLKARGVIPLARYITVRVIIFFRLKRSFYYWGVKMVPDFLSVKSDFLFTLN